MDKEKILGAFHTETIRKGSSMFSYSEIRDVLNRLDKQEACLGCMGPSYNSRDCEDCKKDE